MQHVIDSYKTAVYCVSDSVTSDWAFVNLAKLLINFITCTTPKSLNLDYEIDFQYWVCLLCAFLCLEPTEPPPKTYITKERFEYFKPCVHVEMDNPDKLDSVTEVYIRGV